MTVVCNNCKNYVLEEGATCSVCGKSLVAAGPYTWRDQWAEAWNLDKHQLPFFLLIAGITLATFLFLVFKSN